MERRKWMETIRWIILAAILIMHITACSLNWHQRHFNMFILGFILFNYMGIIAIWFTYKRQTFNN